MPSHEDLYHEMEREEQETANLYRRPAQERPRGVVNDTAARDRYNREIAPVLQRVRRAEAGVPLTDNPLKNLWLRLTGKDKMPDPVVIVDPNAGIAVQTGKTEEEVRQEIIADPTKFAELRKQAPAVRPINASRKSPNDLHR